jgi:hypothetical protein
MNVRAKFQVTKSDNGEIQMLPVYSGSEENKQFFAATPGGSVSMFCTNPGVTKFFEPGKAYYIDFTKAE